jgi:DNA adenine methylase
MRTTTNGMPRYNSNGDFNNSFHVTRNGIIPERVHPIIIKWSFLLNKYYVDFKSRSYYEIEPGVNDFMYLDPPYANTKGMYYGTINYDNLWSYLRNCKCDYFLSFDGIAGKENNIVDIPQDIYSEHLLLDSGNSSFRRVIGKDNNVNVYESLYVRKK